MHETRTNTINCIIYLRLSDLRLDDMDEEGNGKTFADREQKLRDYADRLGWRVYKVVIENDVNGKTGKARNASAFKRRKITLPDGTTALRVVRPGFRECLDHFVAGRAQGLLAEDLDRSVRDPRDLEDLIDVAEAHKINARSLSGSLTLTDGGTDSEITMARFMVTIANKSSRDTQRRVSDSRERQARNGQFGGGGRAFGFEEDGITVRPSEAKVIADYSIRILQLNARTGKPWSLRLLAAELRAGDVPTVTGVPWRPEFLRRILLRPRNAGIMVYRGEEVGKAPWDPIVPEETFRAVVRVLTDPSRTTTTGPAPKWLGSGIFLCGVCGGTTSTCYVTVAGRSPRYTCRARNHLSRNAASLDDFVQDSLVGRISESGFIDKFIYQAKDVPELDVAALHAERESIRVNLDGLAEDRALGLIDREQMRKGTQRGLDRLNEIRELLAANTVESPLMVFSDVEPANVGKVWCAQPLSVKRTIVDMLMTVTILPVPRRGPGFDPATISISWKDPKQLLSSV